MFDDYKNLKNNKTIKVGITINFGIQIFSNGLQQNIIFLKKLFENIHNINPIFIYTGEIPVEDYILKEHCLNYSDFIKEQHKDFDLVILVGFWLEQNHINDIKKSFFFLGPENRWQEKLPKEILSKVENEFKHDLKYFNYL